MKYAIISDVHGNLPALSAVLKDAKAEGVDGYLMLGDYYMCSPYPNEVIDIIKNLPNTHVIRGNEEDYLLTLAKQDQRTWTDGQFKGLYWCFRKISRGNHDYLASLPTKLSISGEKADIFATHSSVEFIGNVEFNEFSSKRISEKYENKPILRQTLLQDIGAYLEKCAEFNEKLEKMPDGIYVFGHTHVQWHAQFGSKLFINPGSCGLPLDGDNAAAYSILEEDAGGWHVLERRILYDVEAFICDLKKSTLYNEAKVWCDVVAREWLTGYEHVEFFLLFVEAYAKETGDLVRPYSQETWSGAYAAWNNRLKHQQVFLVMDFHATESSE